MIPYSLGMEMLTETERFSEWLADGTRGSQEGHKSIARASQNPRVHEGVDPVYGSICPLLQCSPRDVTELPEGWEPSLVIITDEMLSKFTVPIDFVDEEHSPTPLSYHQFL